MTARKFFVGGNWKMNGSIQLVESMATSLNKGTWGSEVEVCLSPPAAYLDALRKKLRSDIHVAAQNIYFEKSGAYTGELSADMLKDLNVSHAIIGHSERREIFRESDEVVAKKVVFAIKSGLQVIACIGEKLDEREANQTTAVCFRQLKAISQLLTPAEWSNVIVAYEPVWAIGTGKVATPEQAQEVHEAIRAWLVENVSPEVSQNTRIIYGGSVNAKNCSDLSKEKDIDGFLVGGASLKEADFSSITHCRL
jgi:triosephosphate isomerase